MSVTAEHPVARLWARHHQVAPYPEGVVSVPEPIPGLAFFPGGYGLWRPLSDQPLPSWPVHGVMILGHDFHSQAGYLASLARGFESPTQPTWRNLRKLLGEAGIAFEECFFTNVYMGLRAGRGTTGVFPGSRDQGFVERCQTFLSEQIHTQRPRLILTLGKYAPRILAALSPQLARWRTATSFRELDEAGAVQHRVDLGGQNIATIVALLHPSLRHASIRRREYKNHRGHAAELAMIQEGQRAAWRGAV